jgi:hypothetical protein
VKEVIVEGSTGRLGTGLLRAGHAVAALGGGKGPGLAVGQAGDVGASTPSSGV